MASTGRCCFCRVLMFPAGSPEVRADPDCLQTREHMIPQSIGPDRERLNIPTNMKPSCHGCNNAKGSAPWQLWAWFIRQPGIAEMGKPARRQSFHTFVYGCALAGFTAAKRQVLNGRPPPPKPSVFTFTATEEIQAENDAEPPWLKGKVRAERGRFARRT
jgi:hypothetical protein